MVCACGRVRRAHHIFPVPSHAKLTSIPGLCLPGTSGQIAASDDFTWCARRTRRWSRAAGCCLSACRFRDRRGCTIAVAGWRRWLARHCWPVGEIRMVVPAGQSLADGSTPFFTRFASKVADGVFVRNRRAGRGGRPPPSRRLQSDSVASGRQPTIPWKNGGQAFTLSVFPSCCVSAPPLCRKAPLST